MTYRLELASTARRDWRGLTPETQRRLAPAIDALVGAPRPPGVTALRGKLRGMLRLRVGDWRIVC